jgi:hypothetical protein
MTSDDITVGVIVALTTFIFVVIAIAFTGKK